MSLGVSFFSLFVISLLFFFFILIFTTAATEIGFIARSRVLNHSTARRCAGKENTLSRNSYYSYLVDRPAKSNIRDPRARVFPCSINYSGFVPRRTCLPLHHNVRLIFRTERTWEIVQSRLEDDSIRSRYVTLATSLLSPPFRLPLVRSASNVAKLDYRDGKLPRARVLDRVFCNARASRKKKPDDFVDRCLDRFALVRFPP